MTIFQRVVKYCAIAFAVYLIVMIVGGILMGIGGVGFIMDRDSDTETVYELKTYTVSPETGEIEIDIGAVDCEILMGESFYIESNSPKLTVKNENGRLIISDSAKKVPDPVSIKMYIPENVHIEKIDISAGAGDIYAESLICSSLYLECGAGDVKIDNAVATVKADIEGGVGEITVGGGSLNDLDLEIGVGSLELTNRLKGECDLEFGVGDADITLIGTPEDYCINYGSARNEGITTVNIEKGIGTVNVDFTNAE